MKKKGLCLEWESVQRVLWLFGLTLAVLVGIGLLFFRSMDQKVEETVIKRVKAQLLVLARSGADSTTRFLEERRADLLVLAKNEAIQAMKEEEGIGMMLETARSLKTGVSFADLVRVDKEGWPIWSVNLEGRKEPVKISLADRDYFVWAEKQKKPGEVYLSGPLVARGGVVEGEWIIILATPVFYQNRFNGLVFLSFSLDSVVENFISSVVTSPPTKALIVSQEGIIVGSNSPRLTGQPIQESFCHQEGSEWDGFPEKFIISEGTSIHGFESESSKGDLGRLVMVWVPIKINGTRWVMFVARSYQEVRELIWPLKIGQFSFLAYLLLGILLFCLLFVFALRATQRRAFIEGFRNGRDGIKKVKKKT